jgi:hypothetical protein
MTTDTLYPHESVIKWLSKNGNRIESTIFFMIVGFCYCAYITYKEPTFISIGSFSFICGIIWNHFDYKRRGL